MLQLQLAAHLSFTQAVVAAVAVQTQEVQAVMAAAVRQTVVQERQIVAAVAVETAVQVTAVAEL